MIHAVIRYETSRLHEEIGEFVDRKAEERAGVVDRVQDPNKTMNSSRQITLRGLCLLLLVRFIEMRLDVTTKE